MLEVAYPYHLDDRGRTTTTTYENHVAQMLELLLLTRPGERVNEPTFGCGLLDHVFAPNSPEIAAALNVTIAASISLWLGDVIALGSVDVTAQENRLSVTVAYTVLSTGTQASLTVSGPGAI